MEFFESILPLFFVLLCIAGIVALGALAYLFITLVRVVKELGGKVDPIVDDAQDIVGRVKPVVEKVDPLLERATLTVDAVNLEIMRVDQILEDVNNVSANVSKVTGAVDAAAHAPLDFIGGIAGKIREHLMPLSDEDGSLGSVVDAVDSGLAAVDEKASTLKSQSESRKVEREEKLEARIANLERANEVSEGLRSTAAAQAKETAGLTKEEKN